MQRSVLNLIIDGLAALFLLGMIATGYLLRFPLPPGTNKNLSLWGLSRHEWGEVHYWTSIGLLLVLLVHIVMHWEWIVSVVQKRMQVPKSKSVSPLVSGLVAVASLATVLALAAWGALLSVKEIEAPCCQDSTESVSPLRRDLRSTSHRPGMASPEVEFWRDVYPILKISCISCHGPSKAEGGFRVDSPTNYFGKESKSPLVVPGSSAKSRLIDMVNGSRSDIAMPDRHRLAEDQVLVLQRWIDSGAYWKD